MGISPIKVSFFPLSPQVCSFFSPLLVFTCAVFSTLLLRRLPQLSQDPQTFPSTHLLSHVFHSLDHTPSIVPCLSIFPDISNIYSSYFSSLFLELGLVPCGFFFFSSHSLHQFLRLACRTPFPSSFLPIPVPYPPRSLS